MVSPGECDVPERSLKEAVVQGGLVQGDSRWTLLSGGRTSHVWRVQPGADDLVCRYRIENRENPLFPGLPGNEIRCLEWLGRAGCAPGLPDAVSVGNGVVLISEYVPGKPWSLPASTAARERDLAEVALLLGRIHDARPFPDPEVRPAGSTEPRRHAHRSLSMCTGNEARDSAVLNPGTIRSSTVIMPSSTETLFRAISSVRTTGWS